MIRRLDSSKNTWVTYSHASLETDLNVSNSIVARKGTDVYGRLAPTAQEAGATCPAARSCRLELGRAW